MENLNYIEDLKIDESALDVEWLEQPALSYKYARRAAELRMEMDMAKDRLEYTRASLATKIRKNPGKYLIDKITNDAVADTVVTRPAYISAQEAFINARFEYENAKGAAEAFDARKSSLENLVRLYGQGYFAGPSTPRDLSNERLSDLRKSRIESGVAKVLRRKVSVASISETSEDDED